MKWNTMLANWLGLAMLMLCCQVGNADDKKTEKSVAPPPPSCTPATPCERQLDAKAAEMMGALFGLVTETMRSNAQVDQEQVQELIKILNETKSSYTLVATTVALAPLGDKAKVAVPVILRNAERLKVLESLGNPESKKGELANLLLESICMIQAGSANGIYQQRGPQRVLTPMPAPPGFAPSPAPFYAPTAVCPGAVCPQPSAPLPTPRGY